MTCNLKKEISLNIGYRSGYKAINCEVVVLMISVGKRENNEIYLTADNQ